MEPRKGPIRSPHGRNRSCRRMSHTNLMTDTSQAVNSHESSEGKFTRYYGFFHWFPKFIYYHIFIRFIKL